MWCRKLCIYMLKYKNIITISERRELYIYGETKNQVFYRPDCAP